MAKKIPEPNNSSLADIAFMLLIFFLVTTTMDVDSGIPRTLPEPQEDDLIDDAPPIRERNVFIVLINSNNQLLVEGELLNIRELKNKTIEFIKNPRNDENLPEMETLNQRLERIQGVEKKRAEVPKVNEAIKHFGGDFRLAKNAVVSLQNDRKTEYAAYIMVQNELVAAFNEVKENMAKTEWNTSYDELSEEYQDIIKYLIPLAISEAEPRSIGK